MIKYNKFILCFSLIVVVLLSACTNKTNENNTKTIQQDYTNTEINNNTKVIQPDKLSKNTKFSSIKVEYLGGIQNIDIDDYVVEALINAPKSNEKYENVKFVFTGTIYVCIQGNETEYEYGTFLIDSEGNKYIKYEKCEGILKLDQ